MGSVEPCERLPGNADVILSYEELLRENGDLRATIARLEARLSALEARNGELEARCAQLEARNAELETRNAKLETRNAELEARLKQNSSNSSIPPSKNPPNAPAPPPKPKSGRKAGGQVGHPGHHRPLWPVDQMDQIVDIKPSHCGACGEALAGNDAAPVPPQVAELPPPKIEWTQINLHALTCTGCGEVTRATLPADVPAGMMGPRLQAFLATCSATYRMSKRQVRNLLKDWFHLDVSLGSIGAAQEAVSQSLAEAVEEARTYVERQDAVHADETGWREGRQTAWLWVASALWVTVFLIHRNRSRKAFEALVRGFDGVLQTDRWNAYAAWSVWKRQLCWAHLIRDFRAFVDFGGADAQIGQSLLVQVEAMFRGWGRVRDGTMSRESFRRALTPVRREVRSLLEQGAQSPTRKVAATSRDLVKLFPALWTFARVPGVEPTNNQAERAIRPAVIWRTTSFGTHSQAGSRFVERMLTTIATLHQQGRNVAEFVTEACVARLHGRSSPSLLPPAHLLTAAP